ncbi:FAD-dependent monooxygenase [Pararhizobium mangrovi]|uniref:FAD-dependent oxidoreductase n=1 Tax=Pararhizobium mangrovi TaxID=2590452 RepID=A0A506UHV8_9HYPH|nr:FAD-dependent monooxygenase [Pararhizobium mangrovi]TPW32897.1 FAD-dependent oxidoreductase [Pararhizobium mangrovi]
MTKRHIAVVGAGIAGLTAAIAFALRGFAVTVLEQAPALSEVGAGVQLSPNAAAILDRLGLLEAVAARWQEIDHVSLVSGLSLRPLAQVPAGAFARDRWGAPYGVIHRAALQTVLLDAARSMPDCRILTDSHVEAASPPALCRAIRSTIGIEPDLVVAADGVWSAVRGSMPRGAPARYAGMVAWRLLAHARALPPGIVEHGTTTALLGPGSHLVAYPVDGLDTINVVALVPGNAPANGRHAAAGTTADRDAVAKAFARWHPSIRTLLETAREPTAWPLYEVDETPWRAAGRVIPIGDAAHAMMPFAAQGTAMAIEDAYDLAATFERSGVDALGDFVQRRRERVRRVRARTAFNRFAYHARGPFRFGRNLVLAGRPAERLAGDLDWLYGYRPPGFS